MEGGKEGRKEGGSIILHPEYCSRTQPLSLLSSLLPSLLPSVDSDVRIQLMTPFKVHVCARAASASAALAKLEGRSFLMERKLDGERYVLHKKGDQLRFFSRNLKVCARWWSCQGL